MEKAGFNFIAMNAVLLFAVISFILIVFGLHGIAFVLELMALLIFMFLFPFSMFFAYKGNQFGWTISGAVLMVLLIDVIFISFAANSFATENITAILFSAIGIVIALYSFKTGPKEEIVEDDGENYYGKGRNYYPYIDKMEVKEEKEPKHEPNVEKTFSPGKFVASKKANKFHSPKCDWALRINKENQIWFNSRQEAEAKGLEADKCVG